MELNNIKRVSSAGYRLPERSNGIRPTTKQLPADRTHFAKGDQVSLDQNPDKADPVKQAEVWKELVWRERRGIRECHLTLTDSTKSLLSTGRRSGTFSETTIRWDS